jgi:hypothetical protein
MDDNKVKFMFWAFMALLTLWPLIDIFQKDRKWWRRLLTATAIVLFWFFGIWDYIIEKREKDNATGREATTSRRLQHIETFLEGNGVRYNDTASKLVNIQTFNSGAPAVNIVGPGSGLRFERNLIMTPGSKNEHDSVLAAWKAEHQKPNP